MSLSERYEQALERERVALSFRTPEAKEVMEKVFKQAEGTSISSRIVAVLKKGLEAEAKDDRAYREDEEDFDWEEYLKDEPINKDSSREDKDEWFDDKADELEDRLDSIESELKNDFNMGGNTMKADENEKIQRLKDERLQLGEDTELSESLQERVDDGEISKIEALKIQRANIGEKVEDKSVAEKREDRITDFQEGGN